MIIKRLCVGELDTNCFFLEKGDDVLIIDPGADADKIINEVINKQIKGIIITHYHYDHIGALDKLKKYCNKVFDYSNLKEGENRIDSFEFKVIYTPGHKEDLISIYFERENILFCGDFIFKNSIGRCDLMGGDIVKMKDSIQKILKYPLDMKIYPGHGEPTTLREEEYNLKKLEY